MDGAQAHAQALQLAADAREHAKQRDYHRRQARKLQRRLAIFVKRCERLGIHVIIDDIELTQIPQGDPSGQHTGPRKTSS